MRVNDKHVLNMNVFNTNSFASLALALPLYRLLFVQPDAKVTKARSTVNDWVYIDIGSRVKKLRKKRGMTQEALAHAVKFTRASVANIESGRQKLLIHTLFDLAVALEVKPLELLPVHYKSSAAQADGEMNRLVTAYDGVGSSWIRKTAQASQKGR